MIYCGKMIRFGPLGVTAMALIEPGHDQPSRQGRAAVSRWAGAVAAVAMLAGGIYLIWTPQPPVGPSPAPPASSGPRHEPSDDPATTARLWLEISRSIAYSDPSATTWTERLAPLLTGPAADENAAMSAKGATGAGWEWMTSSRCTSRVSDVDAVIPPEAPRTDQQVYVQVTGSVRTACLDRDAPPTPPESASATLELHRGPDGQWRVGNRLY